ncbi:hypothetical protein EG346_17785 [Chryseobacterium carnipullorum]|uniref:Uncharacterized protein n=1 Tax=Chryseobacterium carnipullorum TaxID=1124835 RepID=A0A3G6M4V6_CHRCU|nr:hypothetical protein EG346_17785 [Chryseobacterium carnipullorum]AZA64792.1 hypothetical protein EG345_08810 [Chryseobacterium carnipullorum]
MECDSKIEYLSAKLIELPRQTDFHLTSNQSLSISIKERSHNRNVLTERNTLKTEVNFTDKHSELFPFLFF